MVALLTVPGVARADDGAPAPPFHWHPAWSHSGPADYVLTGVGVTSVGLELAFLQFKQPGLRWTGPILFDQAVRGVLAGSTPGIRNAATDVSWGLLAVVLPYPVMVDVPYAWVRYGSSVARDLFWQDSTALSLSAAVDLALRSGVGRARPLVSDCLAAGGSKSQCLGSSAEATMSFPGGHTALVTTSAVLICTQHLTMHLYGAPWDAIACTTALAVDVGVDTLRLVTDNHWTSDILAGSALGIAFGWGVPVLMHLHGQSTSTSAPSFTLTPLAVDHGAGLGVTGWL